MEFRFSHEFWNEIPPFYIWKIQNFQHRYTHSNNETENARQPKLSQDSWKTLESYKIRGNDFDKTLDRLLFGKFEINRKPWENHFGLISWKIFFLELSTNCWWMLEYCRFCLKINYLLTWIACAVPLISKPYARTSQARSVLQNLGLSISRYGPHIRLINSKLVLKH